MTVIDQEIYLYDPIGEDNGGISAIDFAADLRSVSGNRQIIVRINSPGGNLYDGLAIAEHIRVAQRLGHSVATVVDGAAFSAAACIACAGRPAKISASGVLMIHQGLLSHTAGRVEDLQKSIAALEVANKSLAQLFATRSRQPLKKIEEWLAAESWFTAQEAVDAGLLDEVLAQPASIAASFDLFSIPRHVREKLRKPADEKIAACYRVLRRVREASSYAEARSAKELAISCWHDLAKTPGCTKEDLNVLCGAIDEAKYEDHMDW